MKKNSNVGKGRGLGIIMNIVCTALFVLTTYVIASYNMGYNLFGNRYYVESTAAMSPDINKYDVVKADEAVAIEELNAGDTIVFYMDANSDGTREILTRTVNSVELDGEKYIARTETVDGVLDGWYVTEKSYLGKTSDIGGGGKFLSFIKNDNYVVTIIVLSVLFAVYEIAMFAIHTARRIKKEEEGEGANGPRKKSKIAPLYDISEKQCIGTINRQTISIYPKKGATRPREFYGVLPYEENKSGT